MREVPRLPRRSIGRRLGLSALIVVVVGYVPVGATSMWFAWLPGFPRLQQQLDGWLGGQAYATGPGSVAAVRTAAYLDHRTALLIHTTFGALALCLLLLQSIAVHRVRGEPASEAKRDRHRRIGQLYVGAVVVSVVASFVFLLEAPHVGIPGQTAFRLQLWLLGGSTLWSVFAGVSAGRRGDRTRHRAWMVLSGCFLLTAPLLRLMWAALGWLVPGHAMLTNLEVSSVSLAVIAPGMAAIACARLCPRAAAAPATKQAVLAVAIAGLVGEAVLLMCFTVVDDAGAPALYPVFHVLPVIAAAALAAHGYRRTATSDRRAGSPWALLLAGVAAVPWSVFAAAMVVSPWLDAGESLRAGLMCGPGFPLVASMGVMTGAIGQAARSTDRSGERRKWQWSAGCRRQ